MSERFIRDLFKYPASLFKVTVTLLSKCIHLTCVTGQLICGCYQYFCDEKDLEISSGANYFRFIGFIVMLIGFIVILI